MKKIIKKLFCKASYKPLCLIILSFLILNLMAISLVSASFEFDNIKDYNSETKTITIRNSFLGIPTTKVADIKLNTELHRFIIPGEYAFEIEINNINVYENWYNSMELYQKKNPYTMVGKRITKKSFVYKYYDPNYKWDEILTSQDCVVDKDNISTCTQIQVIAQNTGDWVELNEQSQLPKGKITIRGYYPDLKEGETIEWIPTLFGVRIYEWADFTGLTKIEFYEVSDDTDSGLGSDAWRGQTFTIGTLGVDNSYDIKGISILGKNTTGACGNVTWTIQGTDGSGLPNGTFFSIGYEVTDTWANTNEWHNISMTVINNVVGSTKYAIVPNASEPSDCMHWRAEFGTPNPGYAGGSFVFGADGSSWTADTGREFLFKVWGETASIPITMTILNPTNTTFLQTTMDFNVSVVNGTLEIDQCWYSLDAGITNNSLSNDTSTNFFHRNTSIAPGGYQSDFTCNDSAGAFTDVSISFELINHRINSQTFNNITTEGATEKFSINFTKLSSLQVSAVNLIHNGTPNSFPYFVNGDEIISTSSIVMPSINTSINVTFFWNINFDDASSINTSLNNQSILQLNVDNCTSYSNLIYNFTQYDEESKDVLDVNTTMEVQMNLYDSSKTLLLINFSQKYNEINPAQICLESPILTTVNYSSYVTVKYSANVTGSNDFYSTEYYNILNETLGNSTTPRNIALYDLKDADTTKFRLTFRDSSYVLAPNILVQIHRQYIEDNDFKVVEIPLTDSNGQTMLNLVKNDIIYNFIMVDESGTAVATFNSMIVFCQDFTIGECTINLASEPIGEPAYDYDKEFQISISPLTFTNSTGLLSIDFITDDLLPKTVRMEAIRNNAFGNRSVCLNSLTSASGRLTCNVSSITNSDQFLFVIIYVNNGLFRQDTINLNAETLSFGIADGAFYAFLLILLLITLFMDDRRVLLISLALGWVVIISLGLMRGALIGSASAGIWLLVTIGIFLWKLNKEESS